MFSNNCFFSSFENGSRMKMRINNHLNLLNMKRIAIVMLLALFVLSVMSSCKTKDCPAYSQAKTEQTSNV